MNLSLHNKVCCLCHHLIFISTYLSHIGDHAEGDVRESLVQVATNHTDPGKWVPCVGPCLIEGHDVSQVGQFCMFLYQTHLRGQNSRRKRTCDILSTSLNKKIWLMPG